MQPCSYSLFFLYFYYQIQIFIYIHLYTRRIENAAIYPWLSTVQPRGARDTNLVRSSTYGR